MASRPAFGGLLEPGVRHRKSRPQYDITPGRAVLPVRLPSLSSILYTILHSNRINPSADYTAGFSLLLVFWKKTREWRDSKIHCVHTIKKTVGTLFVVEEISFGMVISWAGKITEPASVLHSWRNLAMNVEHVPTAPFPVLSHPIPPAPLLSSSQVEQLISTLAFVRFVKQDSCPLKGNYPFDVVCVCFIVRCVLLALKQPVATARQPFDRFMYTGLVVRFSIRKTHTSYTRIKAVEWEARTVHTGTDFTDESRSIRK